MGLPVPNPTVSFWLDTPGANPLVVEGCEGDLPADVDICIIGSGMTGISVAYHLAKSFALESDTPVPGKYPTGKAVILEARDFCERLMMPRLYFLSC